MRVLISGSDIHAWLVAGHFTIHGDERVTWHTPYAPLDEWAGLGDDEVHIAPGQGPAFEDTGDADILDVLATGDGGVAWVRKGKPPSLEIVDASGKRTSVPLVASGPRVPGIREEEEWCDDRAELEGHGERSIRLFPARGGLFVTAKESGHVVFHSLASGRIEKTYRLPGAPENTIYAASTQHGVLVGMKWNHRHSELFHLSHDGELLARWPNDDTVRWGMPAPAVIGDHVVTYSDEGPYAHSLALLELPGLREVDHVPIREWPSDMHTDGSRFVAVSETVFIGHVEDGQLVIDREWPLREIMRAGNVAPPPRPSGATDDGRGERIHLESQVDRLAIDDGVPVVLLRAGELCAVHGDGVREILAAEVGPTDAKARFTWTLFQKRSLIDIGAGRAIFSKPGVYAIDLKSGKEVWRVEHRPQIIAGRALPGGLFHVDYDPDDRNLRRWCWTPFDGPAAVLSRAVSDDRVFACEWPRAWWFETFQKIEVLSERITERGVHQTEARVVAETFTLCRWQIGDAEPHRMALPRKITALAVQDEIPYVIARDGSGTMGEREHLYRVKSDGAFEQISKEPLPSFARTLVIAGGQALFVEPQSMGKDGEPSKLYELDFATGIPTLVATARIGAIGSLSIASGKAWWLDSQDATMSVFNVGTKEDLAAICSAPLPL